MRIPKKERIFSMCALLAATVIIRTGGVRAENTPYQKGVLKGQVLDQSTENPLEAASIMIEGTSLGTAADNQGRYQIDAVPPGVYNVRFLMMGYETRVVNNVVVNPGRATVQTILLKSTVLETEGITVTAGFFHDAKDAVVSNRSMDFEEIRLDVGSVEDIQRVIQALPAVVSAGDQENEIIVRGGMYGENLFVMDNIEIPNPNHFGYQGAGGGPVNMINNYFVRQVDFFAGAFPARYGDKASSVLDISLREGDRKRRTGHAYLGMSGAGMMIEGPIAGGRGSYLLSGRKSFLDLIISSTGLTAVPKYYNLQGKAVYDIGLRDRIMLNGIYGNDRIHIEEGQDESAYDRGADDVVSISHQYAAGATWRHLYGEKGYSKITLSQTLNYWNQDVTQSGGKKYLNISTEMERAIKAEWTYQPSKRLEFNFGGHYKSIPFDLDIHADPDTTFIFDYPKHPYWIIGVKQAYPAYDLKNRTVTSKSALFGQVRWHPASRLTALFGLRTDYFGYTGKRALDPRIGLSYALSGRSNLNLACGRHSQSPAIVYITSHPDNRDLDYKRTDQVVCGVEHLFREDIRGTVEVFYKDYSGVPVSTSDLTADPFDYSDGRMANEGRGFAKGVEIFLQKKMSRKYHYTASYSYSVSRGRDPRNGSCYDWDFDYRHVFTIMGGVGWDLREKAWYQKLKRNLLFQITSWMLPFADQVEVALRWRYLGGRPYTERTYMPQHRSWITDPSTPLNGSRYPAYHRLDLRLDQRHMFNGWNLVMYFDIINIYGRENIWSYSYSGDGTKKRILQYQVFPVGGLSIEF